MLRISYCLVWIVFLQNTYAADARYVARFSDGSRLEGNALVNWHEVNAQPQLEGKSLWDPANPFRWLRDRTLAPGPLPGAYVEMVTGDRLPGNVLGFSPGGDELDPLPAHFVVEPTCMLRPPQEPTQNIIRVIASQVRKVVWQAREKARYQPGTLLLRDGRALVYRAIRFDDGFASVLTADGNRRVPFNEISEAHLPTTDFWERYLEELAVLSPQGASRLYQLETTEGLIITGSKERLAIHTQGGANEPHRWFHGLQPAWALDILWVANEKVWLRRSFASHEVPLSRVPPSSVKHEALLGKLGDPWQRDRNLAMEPLRSGMREWGFGLGVSTTTDLTFDLPVGAKTIRGSIGLDRLAGKGGCAKGIISAGAKDVAKLWESPVLQGSDAAHDFGPLPCPAPQGPQKLTLRADAMHQGRPTGADPLEVRDFVDWLDPLVEFDPAMMQPAVRQRIHRTIPALAQWQVDFDGVIPGKPPKFEPFLQPPPAPGRYRTGLVLEQPLIVTRKITPTANDQWLVMDVTRPLNQGTEPRLEARIGGELIGEYKVPLAAPNVRPLAVPLVGYQNSKQPEIDVKLTLYADASSGPVEWRSIRTAEQLPTLHRVFEEENHFEAVQGPAPTLDVGDGRFGVQSLKVAAGSVARIEFDRPLKIREQISFGNFRQLRFSLRKKGKGSVLVELQGNGGRRRVLHYGPRQTAPEDAVVAYDRELPDVWVDDFTRDLFGDFQEFDLQAIALHVPDGEFAMFDHMYLAATLEDLNVVQKTPSLEVVNRKRDKAISDELVAKIKPAIAMVDFGDSRIGNAVITNNTGELLTAGHLMVAPNREVKVTMADGKILKAKTKGIFRDIDIGLLKIDEPGSYPLVSVNAWMELGTQQLCVAAAHRKDAKPTDLEGSAVDIRRFFKGTAWTTFEVPNGLTGGPLVEQNGQLVGILTRYSPFGGAEYALTHKLNEVDARLRNAEVWGKWRPGCGPAFGFALEPVTGGAKVTSVDAGGPAAQATLQVGDLVTKFEGQPIRGIDDVYTLLAEKDVGYEATIELLRSGQPVSVKVKLGARTP